MAMAQPKYFITEDFDFVKVTQFVASLKLKHALIMQAFLMSIYCCKFVSPG